MKKVDVMSTTDDGQMVLFTVGLSGGRLKVTYGDRRAAKALGVPGKRIAGRGGKWFSPKEPDEYLDEMKWAFSGSRMTATEVYEE